MTKDDVEDRAFQIFWHCLNGELLAKKQIKKMRGGDPPDFAFEELGKRIALEHTRLENAAGRRLAPAHEFNIKAQIVKRLQELLLTEWADMPPVMLSIQFVSCEQIKTKEQREAVARGVIDLVRRRMRESPIIPHHFFMTELQEQVSTCLGDLQVEAGDGRSTAHHFVGWAVVDESGLSAIQKAANTKAEDLARYAANFDECWLLLDARGPDPSQWIEPSLNSCQIGIDSPFSSIFVVGDAPAKLYKIRTNG